MLRSALVTLMIAGFATGAAAETVYKWVDEGGQVHYTDRPPEGRNVRILSVFEREIVVEQEQEDAGDADEPAESEPDFDSEPDTSGLAASRAAAQTVQADVDRVRNEQCKQAQERYTTYIQSQRLYRELPNGQRAYLSDAELTQARIEAKQAVDDLCK